MRYLYVMLQSLYENNEKGSIDLYVIQRDFTDYDKEMISEITNKFQNKVIYILVDKHKFNDIPGYIGGRDDLPSEIICFRLLLPELLPDTLDRVLLLDVDLVVNKDISELYNIELGDKVLAAAPNMCHNFNIEEEWRRWYPENRTNWIHYNIGILMWNLEKIRNSYPPRYILEQACKQEIQSETFDEELFNVVFGENLIREISAEKWNYIVTHMNNFATPNFEVYDSIEDIKLHCAIIHYAAMNPWQEGAVDEKFQLWWEYAKDSPFYHEFLVEQLSKYGQYIIKLENSLQGEKRAISDLEAIYRLKGSGKIAEYLKDQKAEYYLYGAGMLAEKLYDLLLYEGKENIVKGVFDKKKRGTFYEIPIYGEVNEIVGNSNEKDIIIITPSSGRDGIADDVKKCVNGKAEVVFLSEFLDIVLKTTD